MSTPPVRPPTSGDGPDPPGSPPPVLLGGRYRLERVVGRGAMGRIWAAHDQVLHRPVAIKEVDFPPGMPAWEIDQVAQRTMREARAIASVSDPHVVTVFDMLRLPHGPTIVMELLPARSLAEIIAVDGTLTPSRTATIGRAVAAGLLAAHSVGITHRDVKPGNVLICDDGRIKLTDFGIARSAGQQSMTATGLMLGSPAYIAPEVAAGRPADARSDAWGLGALLFACVQGRPPFDGKTPFATLAAVVQNPVPAHPRAGPLSGVLSGLLVKDPAARMSVAWAHQALLRIADSSGPTPAAPPPRPAPPPGGQILSPDPLSPPFVGRQLPPPPWADSGAFSLPALPIRAPLRTTRQKAILAVLVMLVVIVAAAAGYLGVRVIAHLENGVPILAAATWPAAVYLPH